MPTTYAEVAAHYRRLITDGELAPGDLMPTVRAAADALGTTTKTASRGLQALDTEGLTEVVGSHRTVAARQHVAVTGAQRAEMLTRTGRNYSPGESSVDHSSERAPVTDPLVCHQLDIEPGEEVVIRRRVFCGADGERQVYATSWIHLRAYDVVPEVLTTKTRLTPWWHITYKERTGQEIHSSPTRLDARQATPEDLAALGIDAPRSVSVAVLVEHTLWHDETGPIEFFEDVRAPGVGYVVSK
ncbi:GntR family transcriptional regulator [Kitasatospora indigofera]|uniref:GntR family transcriptional regulator n=1 Tax=Kitasatospora indigofera TaxID=67307 RepID=UPI0033B28EB6